MRKLLIAATALIALASPSYAQKVGSVPWASVNIANGVPGTDAHNTITSQTAIPNGGSTPQTMGTTAATANAAQTAATSASAAASAAQTTANNAATAASAAQTTANAAIPSSSYGQPNGTPQLGAQSDVSALIDFATGALNSRTLAAMGADRINALSQHVVADGTTDDTSAIPAACALAASVGKSLYLPAGRYAVDGVSLNNCTMLIGDGPTRTVLVRKANATQGTVANYSNVSGFSGRDFSIQGQTSQAVPAIGLEVSGSGNFDLQNVQSNDNNSTGLLIINNTDKANGTVSGLFRVSGTGNGTSSVKAVGVELRDVNNMDVLQSSAVSNSSNGLLVDFGAVTAPLSWVGVNHALVFDEFTALGNGASGMFFPGFIGPQTTSSTQVNGNGECPSDSVAINGAHAESNQGYGLVVQGCGFMVTNGLFRQNGRKVNGFFGGFFAGVLANADNSIITGNVMDSNEYYGMDAGGCFECKITLNLVKNNGKQSSSSGGVGINVGAARYTDVDDNTFIGNGFIAGGIVSLTIPTGGGGTGYTAPTATATGGSGSGASLAATESGGVVTGVTITNGGSLWLNPIVTSTGGGCTTQPTYSPTVTQAVITFVAVLTPGAGCSSAPTVTATDGTGFAATGIVSGGVITGWNVTNPGQGYISSATITISDTTGTGATATASIGLGNELIAHRLDGTGTTTANGTPIAFGWDASHLRFRRNKFLVDSSSDFCIHVLEDIQYLDVEDNHCSNPLEVSGSLWFDAYWLESTLMHVHNNTTDQTFPFDQHYHQSGGDVMTIPDQYEKLVLVSAGPSILSIEPEFIANNVTSVYKVLMTNPGTAPYTSPVAVASGGGCTTEPTLQAFLAGPNSAGAGLIANIGVTSAGSGCTSAPTVAITDATGTGAGATAVASVAPWGNLLGRDLTVFIETSGFTFPNTGSRLKLNSPYSPSAGDTIHFEGLNAVGALNEITRATPLISSAIPGTPTACGTTPTVVTGSTDLRGTINIGSGTVTACSVVFGVTHPSVPICTASTNNTAVAAAVTGASDTGFTLGFSASLGGGQVNYSCEP